jgi:hypothetical protein
MGRRISLSPLGLRLLRCCCASLSLCLCLSLLSGCGAGEAVSTDEQQQAQPIDQAEWPPLLDGGYNVSWIANSWGGGNCSVAPMAGCGWTSQTSCPKDAVLDHGACPGFMERHCWVKTAIGGMAVHPASGNVFTSSGWDEAHNELQIFLANGREGGKLTGHGGLGWTNMSNPMTGVFESGIGPITTTDKYVFYLTKKGSVWGVGRYINHHSTNLTDNSDNFPPADFNKALQHGVGNTKNVLVLGFNHTNDGPTTAPQGLVACDGALYYYSANTSSLTVYDPEHMTATATHQLSATNVTATPNPLVCGPSGLLFLLRSDRVSAIKRADGTVAHELAQGLIAPGALAFDAPSATLFVSDTGLFSQTYGSILTVILHINDVPCYWQTSRATTC